MPDCMISMKELYWKRQVFEDDYTSTQMLVILTYVNALRRKTSISSLEMTPGKSRQWIDECAVYIKVIKGAVLFPGRRYLPQWVWEGVLLCSGELSLTKQEKPPAIIDAFACTDILSCFHKLHKTVRVDLSLFDRLHWTIRSKDLNWSKSFLSHQLTNSLNQKSFQWANSTHFEWTRIWLIGRNILWLQNELGHTKYQ